MNNLRTETPVLQLKQSKGRFPLDGIFREEWYFLFPFDAHSPPIGL